MRVPQVSERIKEAPAQALRGVFAGIGQLLLITDRLRNKASAGQQVPQARRPEPDSQTAAPAAPAPAPVSTAEAPGAAGAEAADAEAPAADERDFEKTGNVRLLTKAEAAAADTAPTSDATVAEEAGAPVTAGPVTAGPVIGDLAAGSAGPALAVANYDELSVPSLRARLRNLSIPQLRELIRYEQGHADRAEVITMFERRIAKLQAETTPEITPEERGEAEAAAEIEAQEDAAAEIQEEVAAEAEGEE
jgi:hypothetical protein